LFDTVMIRTTRADSFPVESRARARVRRILSPTFLSTNFPFAVNLILREGADARESIRLA
jgi:hypothetical protein